MPWSRLDSKKHSKSANPTDWAKIANKALEKYKDEGTAIRVANAKAPKKGK